MHHTVFSPYGECCEADSANAEPLLRNSVNMMHAVASIKIKYATVCVTEGYFALRRMLRSGFGYRQATSQKLRKYDARCCIIFTEGYRSGHNEAVLKNSRFCHCKIVKTLDFIGFFAGSSALCEMVISQFSRKFLAVFSQFPKVFEPILNWFGDYLGLFNSLRRHIEAVITRLS